MRKMKEIVRQKTHAFVWTSAFDTIKECYGDRNAKMKNSLFLLIKAVSYINCNSCNGMIHSLEHILITSFVS